ncbi:murein biosynthesis integral membrane protein MurJ [Cellulophaga baltica]|uniref:murein biosynthesis integral membrane protein MurJ n=1 Tax=Cellulophaga baltica TaxID=76594 RepID=UPI0015F762CF|nr:lipid II flippase MurJ [Cellulophaga baltica]MBA6313758.1 hypothetical protein [Cellulophaga baltica]
MNQSWRKSLGILLVATIISKAIGFIRELILASKFGVTQEFDVLLAIFAIPTTIVSLLLYAVPHIIIPRLDLTEKNNSKFYKSFSEKYFWAYILFLTVLTILYTTSSILYIKINSAKIFDQYSKLNIYLILLFGLYIFLNSIYTIIKALYNAKEKFILPSFSPLIIHISIILSVTFFYRFGVISFAFGLVLGSLLQLLVYFVDFKRKDILKYFKFSLKPNKLEYSSYLIILLIEFLGQSYMLIDRSFLAKLPQGHISAIHYASIINNLPVTVVGMSIGTLIFPTITKFAQNKEYKKLQTTLTKTLIASTIIGLSLFILFYNFGEIIISLLLERGKFEHNAVIITSNYLVYLAIGLPFILVHVILTKLCFAFHKENILLISTICAISFKYLLSLYFIQEKFYFGLSLSTSLAFIFNVILLMVVLYKLIYYRKTTIDE